MHHIAATGIIDPDDRDAAYLAGLANNGIFALGVAQVENLLAAEPVLRACGAAFGLTELDVTVAIAGVTADLLAGLLADRPRLVGQRAHALIQSRLRRFRPAGGDLPSLHAALTLTVAAADAAAAHADASATIDSAIANGSLGSILEVFRNKSVPHIAAVRFGKTDDAYEAAAIEALANAGTRTALGAQIPQLPG